jgi:anti-anti-sigma factor
MPLTIDIQNNTAGQRQGMTTVELNGSLDTATAPDLERALAPVLSTPVKDLVFDLTGLSFITSAGLRVLTSVRKQLAARGGAALFFNPQPQIREVFEIVKALPGIAIFRNDAEMDAYLTTRQMRHLQPKQD